MKKTTIKETALLFMIDEKGGAISPMHRLSEEYKHLNMGVLRSLEKKNLVFEDKNLFFLSESGKEIIKKCPKPLPPVNLSDLKGLLEMIKDYANRPQEVKSIVNQIIKTYIDRNY